MGFYDGLTFTRKVLSLFGGFLIHLVIGTIYTTGSINIYTASYFQEQGISLTKSDLSIILPLQFGSLTSFLMLGSHLTLTYNPWITTITGTLILSLSVFSASYILTFPLFALVYGVFYGIGAGLCLTTPLIISWSHFPHCKGRISGIILTGFGLGGFIFNLISHSIINPDNKEATVVMNNEKYFDKSIAEKFPEMLRTLALIYLIISTIGISLLTQLIPVKKEVFLGENLENECPSVKVALKTKQFWLLFLMSACSVGPGIYFLYVYKGFAMETLNDDEFLTLVGSVGLLFNGGFRSIWGDFMDRTSFKVSYAVLVIIQIVMSLTLFYTVTEKWVYLVWIAVILICEGGNFSLFPTIFAKMYGRNMGAKVYGIFALSYVSANVISYVVPKIFEEILDYQGLFIIMGLIPMISVLSMFLFHEKKLWVNPVN